MGVLAEKYRYGEVERSARDLWAARGFPRPDGVVGRSTAPIVRQFEGSLLAGDDPGLVAFRAVAADTDARYLALAGRRAIGTLRSVAGANDDPAVVLLRDLSVWTGGSGGLPVDSADRRGGVEAILGRMASRGLVATRDTSLRICPTCAQPRSPERIIYQEEDGDTYLVRFPLPYADGVVNAIVWVDAPWRLLGASALLVSPNLPYVVARYRRRGLDEKILTSRPSLSRLLEWLPGGEVEVLEESPGSRWQGQTYQYPLRHEFPMGGDLTPPSGTILAVADVGESGTGIVPLVPGHGGTDALIADRLGILGWPLVTARGQLDFNIAHKYSGLDIPTASEFVARDLGESGALFARLRVRRGVPHCAICGTPMVWAPGRAWCLEPSRLPPERRDLYRRLLPKDPPVGQVEVAAWPVSEPTSAPPGPFTVTLLECPSCERLEPLGAADRCSCGSRRNPVSRRLLPSISGTLAAWARFDPFPAGDSVWLYLNERRRSPALVHHLAVMSGVAGVPNDLGVTILPGIPEGGVPELVKSVGADAVRAALIGGEKRESSGPTFPDRCQQEGYRLERWWYLAQATLDRCDPSQLAAFAQSITGSLAELETEDRAILARWERIRLAALADYDHQSAGTAFRRVANFLSNDLEAYVGRVRPRLDLPGTPPTRRGALRTLHHLLRESAVILAPVAPHIAEVVWGGLVPGRTSLFESAIDPLDSSLLDEEAVKAWDRWASVGRAVAAFRRRIGVGPSVPIPSVIAILGSDELAAQLRADRATLQRLGHVGRFEAFGPSAPWTGRERAFEPVLSEIQRVYPQEAGQILHLLKRMPARKRTEGAAPDELSVVVRGLSRRILPSMVEFVEQLPDRVVAVPWNLGELYIELPAQQPVPTRNPPPGSPDAFRLLSRVEHELRRTATTPPTDRGPVVVATLDPLAAELRALARPLAAYLGVSEVRVVDPSAEFPRTRCLFGRTRTGVHWWALLPGEVAPAVRTKHRMARPRLARVRSSPTSGIHAFGETDFASEAAIAHSEEIRTLMQELDGILEAPLLGPTAVEGAWSAGFHSLASFGQAPFDQISAIPGFGRPLTAALVGKLGGVVPPRPPRLPSTGTADPAAAAPLTADTWTEPTRDPPEIRPSAPVAPTQPRSVSLAATARQPDPGRMSPVSSPPRQLSGIDSTNPVPPPGASSPTPSPPPAISAPTAEVAPPPLPVETATLTAPSREPEDSPAASPELASARPENPPESPPSSGVSTPVPTSELEPLAGSSLPERDPDPPMGTTAIVPSDGGDLTVLPLGESAPQEPAVDLGSGEGALDEVPAPPPEFLPVDEVAEEQPLPPASSTLPESDPLVLDAESADGESIPRSSRAESPESSSTKGAPETGTSADVSTALPSGEPPIDVAQGIDAENELRSEPSYTPTRPELLPPWGYASPDEPTAKREGVPDLSPAPEVAEREPAAPPDPAIPDTIHPESIPTLHELPSAIDEPAAKEEESTPSALALPESIEPLGIETTILVPGIPGASPSPAESPAPENVEPASHEVSPSGVGSVESIETGPPVAEGARPELTVTPPPVLDPAGPSPPPLESQPPSLELEPSSGVLVLPEHAPPQDESTAGSSGDSLADPAMATAAPEVLADTASEIPLEPPAPEPRPTEEQVAPEPVPPLAEAIVAPVPPPTPTGGITLTVAPSYLPAFAHFLDATAAGHRGICVVRESPDRLRTHVGPRPVEIYWLSNVGRGLTLRPSDLEGYGSFLANAVEQDRVTAIFLEGVEYLARIHGAERVIEQLAGLHVVAQAGNARVWVYIHPDLIPPADLTLFLAAFGNAPPIE